MKNAFRGLVLGVSSVVTVTSCADAGARTPGSAPQTMPAAGQGGAGMVAIGATGGSASGSSNESAAAGTALGGTTPNPVETEIPSDPKGDPPVEVHALFPEDVIDIKLRFKENGAFLAMINTFRELKSREYYEASIDYNGETLSSVGVRLKGFSSLGNSITLFEQDASNIRFPMQVDFNHFGGPRFHGNDRVLLSSFYADRFLMTEQLAAAEYAALGVPVALSGYAKVTIDETYAGLFRTGQEIDKRFLKQHMGTDEGADDGNLYKCVIGTRDTCSLAYFGDQKSDYVSTEGCPPGTPACGLVLKTNENNPTKNTYADVIHFLDVLNNTSDAEFPDAIEKVLDIDAFLRLAAVTVVIVNHDSYFGFKHNFYLYHHPVSDKFMMIPWDLNFSYGYLGCGKTEKELVELSIDAPTCKGDRPDGYPLVDKILAVPKFKSQYRKYIQQLVNESFTVDNYRQRAQKHLNQLKAVLPLERTAELRSEYYLNVDTDLMPTLLAFINKRREYLLNTALKQ